MRFLLKLFFALLFPLFVCGGVVAGYYFFDTVRTYVASSDLPGNVTLIPGGGKSAFPLLPSAPQLPNVATGDRINVLLLGIDRREGEKGPWRTDTMIVATLDPKTKTAGMLSIPRDLYVPIPAPGAGESRINTANYYGDLTNYPGGGPALAKKTVEYNLGIPIHYYVLIDFSGFRKIVDELGGIDVDVPAPIDDYQYPTEDYGIKTIHIPAGHLHMNGELALEYARTRHTTSDFDRSRRQMQIILAIRQKALKLNVLPKLPDLIARFRDTVHTDLTPEQMIALAPLASQIRTDNIQSRAIDQTMTTERTLKSGADVLFPNRDKIAALIREMFPETALASPETTVQSEAARIVVLNGTNKNGYAQRAADYLKARGLNVVQLGNADRRDYAQSVILDYADKPATRTALVDALAVKPSNVQSRAPNTASADFYVIIGADWVPPSATAK